MNELRKNIFIVPGKNSSIFAYCSFLREKLIPGMLDTRRTFNYFIGAGAICPAASCMKWRERFHMEKHAEGF